MSRRFLLTPAARSDLIEIDEYLCGLMNWCNQRNLRL
jgi:hypothetical protein